MCMSGGTSGSSMLPPVLSGHLADVSTVARTSSSEGEPVPALTGPGYADGIRTVFLSKMVHLSDASGGSSC
jgi:hypothetical protein